MRLAQVVVRGEIHLALEDARGLVDLNETARRNDITLPGSMIEAMETGVTLPENCERFYVCDPRFAPVVTNPQKIVCVGTNYRKHLLECGEPFPKAPLLFSKFASALNAHDAPVMIPTTSRQIDYEAELVIVIGKRAKHLAKQDAFSAVFGYTLGNDVSARDLQTRSSQWLIGKTQDGFAPTGPFVTTRDEVDPDHLAIGSKVNGEQRQSANTSDMIFDCATIVSYASDMMTLKPGDLIFTGTPHGVILGYPEEERVWLRDGDVVEIEIEKLGTLRNRMCE